MDAHSGSRCLTLGEIWQAVPDGTPIEMRR